LENRQNGDIRKYLQKQGYTLVSPAFYQQIELWLKWYQGKGKEFHSGKQDNGEEKGSRQRDGVNMAKKVAEDWANLELNEKVEITVSDPALDRQVQAILDRNNFPVRANQLVELTNALGTGAIVEYLADGDVALDYVRANRIYPLSWDNGEITECAFVSDKIMDGERCVYVNLHVVENGQYTVKNKLFSREGFKEMELPKGIEPEWKTGSTLPMFQIVTPSSINCIDLDNPMGISVYANAIEILKGLDLADDSFEDKDTELKARLNRLSVKCGLGNTWYDFEGGCIKTATGAISEQSDLYRNLRKNEVVLKRALRTMVQAILHLIGADPFEAGIKITFDESRIKDQQSELSQKLQLVAAGIMQKWELRKWYFGEDESTAKAGISAASQM
jgi:phage portal protein, SPP1 gp6-like